MICNKCNFQNEETAKFCRECGAELKKEPAPVTITCPKCNFQNSDNMKFCGKCGAKFNINPTKPSIMPWVLFASALVVCVILGVLLFTKNGIEVLLPPNDKIQLPEVIIDYSNNTEIKFEYDERNRITKELSYANSILSTTNTYTYNGDDLIKKVYQEYGRYQKTYTDNYSINENKITTEHYILYSNENQLSHRGLMHLNIDGYPTHQEWFTYCYFSKNFEFRDAVFTFHFENGNLTKRAHQHYQQNHLSCIGVENGTGVSEFKFDNNKTPFYNCKMPKWFSTFGSYERFNKNNVIEVLYLDKKFNEYYEYDYDSAGFPIRRTNNGKVDMEIKYMLK